MPPGRGSWYFFAWWAASEAKRAASCVQVHIYRVVNVALTHGANPSSSPPFPWCSIKGTTSARMISTCRVLTCLLSRQKISVGYFHYFSFLPWCCSLIFVENTFFGASRNLSCKQIQLKFTMVKKTCMLWMMFPSWLFSFGPRGFPHASFHLALLPMLLWQALTLLCSAVYHGTLKHFINVIMESWHIFQTLKSHFKRTTDQTAHSA